jgi:hypothetical protein
VNKREGERSKNCGFCRFDEFWALPKKAKNKKMNFFTKNP